MEDINATCIERDCGNEFTITADEQQRFADLQMTLPKRCFPCRKKRKLAREQGQSGNY